MKNSLLSIPVVASAVLAAGCTTAERRSVDVTVKGHSMTRLVTVRNGHETLEGWVHHIKGCPACLAAGREVRMLEIIDED